MKLRTFLISTLLLLAAENAIACNYCLNNGKKKAHAKTTMADPAEDHYDVKHLRFNLQVSDTGIYVRGNVTTTAEVTAGGMGEYVFELAGTFTIDSAKINGSTLPVTTTGAVRRITLPVMLTPGSMFTAQIFYRGMPPTGTGFFNGITHSVSSGGTHMMYTVSDPWVALNWWPCKQSVNDQADSVDMFVKVPAGVKVGSNGLLLNVDNTTDPGYDIFHWKTRYPIDYYLISLAVARYAEYKSYMHFTASTDSMLIHNFFMDTASFNPSHKAKFDSVDQMVNYFSELFGRYPFWKEKYGMCFTTLGGGMEHQTMTTIGVTNTTTIAHELAHQWFGDDVTYKTWGDMWLSEGFATFSEQLYLNKFWSPAAARTHRQNFLVSAQTRPCGMAYVNDTTTSDSLFTVNQYPKSAMIINTLRYLAPEDSLFFRVLRRYQSTHSRGNASTADFKAIAEAEYGMSLDTFFNQWIYGRGFPTYNVRWNQSGSTVWVKLMQSQSCPSYTSHFSTPVEVHLRAGSVDTFIKVYNSVDTQVFSFEWSQTVTNVFLNTNAQTLLRANAGVKDATLGIGAIMPGQIKIRPNPTRNYWELDELPGGTELALLDINGKVLWTGNSAGGTTTIPGEKLPAGNYLLRVNGVKDDAIQLVRW